MVVYPYLYQQVTELQKAYVTQQKYSICNLVLFILLCSNYHPRGRVGPLLEGDEFLIGISS